jgi:hypothetical protein
MSYPQDPSHPYGQSEQDPDSPARSFGASAPHSDFPGKPYYDGRNRQGMVLVVVVATMALGVGGYFLLSSKANATVAFTTRTNQVPEGRATPTAPANAPFAAQAPSITFVPPTVYSSNSLVADPGCVDYNNATDASNAAIGDTPTAEQASSALTDLDQSLHSASAQAQDHTLAAALAAESLFVQQDQAALVAALASGDSDSEANAFQPIEVTDDYVSSVCGTDLSADTSAE